MIKWGLSRGSKDGSVSANQPTWYTTLTNQKIKIISLDLENASEQNSTSIYDKIAQQSVYKENILTSWKPYMTNQHPTSYWKYC